MTVSGRSATIDFNAPTYCRFATPCCRTRRSATEQLNRGRRESAPGYRYTQQKICVGPCVSAMCGLRAMPSHSARGGNSFAQTHLPRGPRTRQPPQGVVAAPPKPFDQADRQFSWSACSSSPNIESSKKFVPKRGASSSAVNRPRWK
jgi:hypothetical protein